MGYIRGRYIVDNIRIMLDVLEMTKDEVDLGLIVMVDFEKAFDTVSWDFFLHKTLEFFKFGPTFKTCIKLIYASPECCVTKNRFHREFFSISRGIRQGCPISALLFIMCAKVLAIAIREQQNIKGIVVGTKEIKLTQYADDTCVYLNSSNSLENMVKLFEDFYRYAVLKLNIDKTEAIWLGRNNRYGKTWHSNNARTCKTPRHLAFKKF